MTLSLTRADLERALAPLGEARMLPAAAYVDEAVLAWERTHVLDAGWVAVAHASTVDAPGAQAAARVGVGSVVAARDGSGVLRAFANVCRHRGHELVAIGERVCRPSIRCPYHGWTYDLAGTLQHASGGADPDPTTHSLRDVRVAEHLGWVFVNVDGAAAPLTETLAGVDAILGRYDVGALVPLEWRTYEVAANWKVINENYQECLHCPFIHPELCRVSPPDSGDNLPPGPAWVGGWMDLAERAATMSMTGAAVGTARPALDAATLRRVAYVALLPSLLVAAHPDYVLTHRLEPLTPSRTLVTCEWLAARDADHDALAGAIELWDCTNSQDWAACESVQRGLASGAYVPGPLTPREDAVHGVVQWFARQYAKGIDR